MISKTVQTRVQLVLVAVVGIVSVVAAGIGDGGSKCPDTSCTPAPPGVQCDPRYERDDGCCPVWHCSNGQTAYGVSKGGGGSSGSSSSFSYSSGSGGGAPDLSGVFGNLFANLLG